jgi:hypothetical protein
MLIDSSEFKNNINKMQQLFKVAFNRDISEQMLVWRYINNPCKQTLASVFNVEGNLIANYSACPCYLSHEGKVTKTALSMTTMTDPNHRRKGMFPMLAEELYEAMARDNYYFILGFPNHLSHQIFTTYLGWRDIYEIPTMSLDLTTCPNKDSVRCETDNYFELIYDDSIISDEYIHVVKDQQYLQWRYANNPVNEYINFVISKNKKVCSYLVLKKYGQSLDIVDFQAAGYEEGEYLLKSAITYAIDQKLKSINCWAPLYHFIHRLCEKNGFRNGQPITYFAGKVLNRQSYKKDFFDYRNWYIQMGDSDVY